MIKPVDPARKRAFDELKRQNVPYGEGSTGRVMIYHWFDLDALIAAIKEEKKWRR